MSITSVGGCLVMIMTGIERVCRYLVQHGWWSVMEPVEIFECWIW